jgi:hypothetical protein
MLFRQPASPEHTAAPVLMFWWRLKATRTCLRLGPRLENPWNASHHADISGSWSVFHCLVLLVLLVLSLASVTALARPDRRSADVNVVPLMQHGHTLANSTASPEFDSGMNAAPESDSGTSSFAASRRSRARDNVQRFKKEVAHGIIWLIRMDSKVKS